MKKEDYKDGMTVTLNGRKFIATELELCNDGSHVVHLTVSGREANLRIPIDLVEAVQK